MNMLGQHADVPKLDPKFCWLGNTWHPSCVPCDSRGWVDMDMCKARIEPPRKWLGQPRWSGL
jgi:hypothetical protein